jgi:ABC-type amino acid transport substrate-binding protein
MMSPKLFPALCAIVALTLTSAACGNDNHGPATASNPYHLITPGVITAATLTDNPPFALAGTDGKPQGFAIDLAQEAAKRLGLRIDYKVTGIQGLLTGLAAEQYDMGIAGVGATAERKQTVDFIRPYYWGFTAVITSKEATAQSLNDFAGKRIGAVSGSVQENFAKTRLPGAIVVLFPDSPSAIAQLLSKGIDGFVVGGADAETYTEHEPTLKIAVTADSTQGTAFPIKKGNAALLTAVDTKIDEMIVDGTFLKLYQKWFKRPLSPRMLEFRPSLANIITPASPSASPSTSPAPSATPTRVG